MDTENPMRNIRIEKVTLNIGVGRNPNQLEKGMILLKELSGMNPVKTITKKRIAQWGLRPGLPIGCKVTIRSQKKYDLLKRLLQAKDNVLTERQFDDNGNLAFGIHEYINIPGIAYNPQVGIIGLEVCITLERPGFRIKKRKSLKRSVPKKHLIAKDEAINFMRKEFGTAVGEKE